MKTKLRIKYKPYRKGHGGRTGRIPVDLWIDDRPDKVNKREELGHWESDTMEGKKGGAAIATHVERKSRYTVALPIAKKRAANFTTATIEYFQERYHSKVKSFTFDHGKECSKHKDICRELNALVYFAHVGAPWERGTNENTNGLLRQWFPRKTDLSSVTQSQLDEALDLLNHRPRKCLGWKSPFEVFFDP